MIGSRVAESRIVLIRGAGELGSGVGWVLTRAGYRVVMTEVEKPLMVRWPVSFGTVMAEGYWQVEGVAGRRIEQAAQCEEAWKRGEIPVLADPELRQLSQLRPDVLVDAILAKRNTGTKRNMASLTIGLGPGFTAGEDVDQVVETNRGHNLGRVIHQGPAEANTGIPGNTAGYTWERVLYSGTAGVFKALRSIGDAVNEGDVLAEIRGISGAESILSPLSGTLRGLLRTGTPVGAHVKVGDVDPRGRKEYCTTISDKARSVGGGVLLAILEWERLYLG
nr:selenium-dependent molybdenum cofactor biosynthesis protein YqeB [Acididesulfobacillus acetoxydans]